MVLYRPRAVCAVVGAGGIGADRPDPVFPCRPATGRSRLQSAMGQPPIAEVAIVP